MSHMAGVAVGSRARKDKEFCQQNSVQSHQFARRRIACIPRGNRLIPSQYSTTLADILLCIAGRILVFSRPRIYYDPGHVGHCFFWIIVDYSRIICFSTTLYRTLLPHPL